jgi:hypothetical protein
MEQMKWEAVHMDELVSTPQCYIYEVFRWRQMNTLPLQHKTKIHTPHGQFGQVVDIPIERTHIHRSLASLGRKPRDHAACPLPRSLLTRPVPSPPHRVFGLGFVAKPRNLTMVLWINHHKPHRLGAVSTPSSSWLDRHSRPGSVLVLWSKPTNPTCRL